MEIASNMERAADLLRQAREAGCAIAPVAVRAGIVGSGAAYAVQSHNTRFWLAQGRRLSGRKIGLTSEAVQKQLGVSQPDYGNLFKDMEFHDGDIVPSSRLMQPRVEAEVAFVLGADIGPENVDKASLAEAIAYALPAIEIVDSAIRDWNITFEDTVADNASSGLYVLGRDPVPMSEIDLELAGMVMTIDGASRSIGVGAACLGHPLNALGWLARTMIQFGQPLKAGEVVLSGALGPMAPIRAGESCQARIAGLGSVSFKLD